MRVADQNPPAHNTIFDAQELGQYWFQDG